ncbi:MAG: sensor histidine kinase [Hyphomicrobiaceae bacterium]
MRTTLSGIYNFAIKRLSSDRLNSLAFRLFATSVLWTLVVLPLTGLVIYSANRSNVLEAFDSRLELLAYGIEAQNFGAAEPIKPENLGEVLFDHSNSGWYWQIQPVSKGDGPRLVSDSLATSSLPSPFLEGAKPNAFDFRRIDIVGPLDQPLRIIERIGRLGDPDKGPRYSFIVAGPLDWPEQKIADFAFDMAIALAVAALGLLIATFFQIRFGLSPLRLIGQGLADIRSGRAASLGGDLPAEIKPLQVELNALMDSNQEIIDRARTQVGNLAHALKTPLAVITNEARDSGTAFADKVSEQAELMRNQVTHYLDRARVAASVGTIGRITDVHPVAAGLKRALERIYRDKGVSIVLDGTEQARFLGEKQDLEEMLGNLLDNACKWSRNEVRLSLSDEPIAGSLRSGMLIFEIEDDGPGLSQEERAKIGKRGVRLDESTPGTGLGLSIVHDLAATYHGNCALDASHLGGLKVRLELPSAAHQN